MSTFIHVFIFIALVLKLCSSSDVLEFSDDDFSTEIKEHETALIMFYAPWCGHCKNLKPEFEKAASSLAKTDLAITLGKIDCTEGGKDTCGKLSVSGYPTLKIFKNGKFAKEYNGPRKAAGIVKYMKSQVGPSAKKLTSRDGLMKFLDESDFGVVGFFPSSSSTSLKENYLKCTDFLRDKLRFGITEDNELASQYDINEGILLFRPKHLQNKFEPNFLKYDGSDDKDEIDKWIRENKKGLVDHRKKDNMEDFKNPLVVAYYDIDYDKNPKGTNYWRNRILKVAQNYAKDFNFAISSKDEFKQELDDFGYIFDDTDKPIVLARSDENEKFVLKEEFSVENFDNFLNKLKEGELEPYLKSEPIPETNDGPVKVVVGKSFNTFVLNNNKDTFVEFYAPWCGHCKKLAPVWELLGEKMSKEDVEIVKMDGTKNDVPQPFEVRGFPTIYWVGKDSKTSPTPYSGGRDLDDLIKYVAKHSTEELKGYDRSGNSKSKTEL